MLCFRAADAKRNSIGQYVLSVVKSSTNAYALL